MGQTLTNGIYLPDEGERNSYSGLEANWRTLDALILTINGKAAPNVANTWTAAQTFTAGIIGDLTGSVTGNVTGDLTGTASKAIADEDGTDIKTGYVNRTTNQSIAGQKTFFDNTFFPSPVYHKNTTYEIGNIPASNVVTNIYLADKNNVYTGFTRSVIYASGRTATEIRAKNTFKNGVLDPTGADISSNLNVEVQPNGTKTIYWDSLIRNDVTPFTTNNNSLGTSSNKWKTLNGINPGALSLPSHSAYVDILSSITHTDWTVNYYTPAINGYIALNVNGCAIIQPYGVYGISAGFYDGTIRINDLRVCLPVIANQTYEIWVLGTVNEARLFACLGNV